MASCYAPNLYWGLNKYDDVVTLYLKWRELGIYSFYGEDAASVTFTTMLCRTLGGAYCLLPDQLMDWYII